MLIEKKKLHLVTLALGIVLLITYGCATTPLLNAIRQRNAQKIHALLDSGSDPNEKGKIFTLWPERCNNPLCTLAPFIGLPGIGIIMCPISLTFPNFYPLDYVSCGSPNQNKIARILIEHGAIGTFSQYARVHPGNSGVSVTPAKAGVQAVNEGLGSGGNRDSPQGTVPISAPISVNTPDYRGRGHPDDFAVVVGVEKYAQDLPAAEFADEDAKAFRAHLLALGVPARHIVYLSDERAGRSELVKNIERWLPKNVKSDSRVYFYFSGHGAPDPSTGDAYLLPFSGDPADLSDTAYPLSRLYANLGKLKARHVIVALDSCFSGAGGRSVIASGTRPLVNRVKEGVIPQNGKLIVLTASKSDQTSGVLKDKKHGTFTYYLLKGLNGKALDSKKHVTIDSLYSYLAPKVEDAAHLDDRDQDPQLKPKTRFAQGLTLR
jgi:hypothetical protein